MALGLGISPGSLTVENAFRNHTYGREITLMNPNDENVEFSIVQETNSGVVVSAEPAQGVISAQQKKIINVFIFIPAHLLNRRYEDILLAQMHTKNDNGFVVTPSLAVPVRTELHANIDTSINPELADDNVPNDEIEPSEDTVGEESASLEDNSFEESFESLQGEAKTNLQDQAQIKTESNLEEKSSTPPTQQLGGKSRLIGNAGAFFKKQNLSLVDVSAFVIFLVMLVMFTIAALRGKRKGRAKRWKQKKKHKH